MRPPGIPVAATLTRPAVKTSDVKNTDVYPGLLISKFKGVTLHPVSNKFIQDEFALAPQQAFRVYVFWQDAFPIINTFLRGDVLHVDGYPPLSVVGSRPYPPHFVELYVDVYQHPAS